MKAATIFRGFLVTGVLLLFHSCATIELGRVPAGNLQHTASLWENQLPGDECRHRADYPTGMYTGYPFALSGEPFTYCQKCGRYVRGKQQVGR